MYEGLNLTKIISGISKGLDFANRAIPIYQQIKPILYNAKDLINIASIINTPDKKDNNTIKDAKEIKKIDNNNLPTFFQ